MSNMDFFQIGALKVFAELGQLIEEDESKQIKFMNLPIDIIQNNILNHLKKDKTINKIFYDNDDYYLQNLLCGKLEKMNYIKPYEWNEYETDLNLDCVKNCINYNHKFFKAKGKINKLQVTYKVNRNLAISSVVFKAYDNNNNIVSARDADLDPVKECCDKVNLLKQEIKEYIKNYKEN